MRLGNVLGTRTHGYDIRSAETPEMHTQRWRNRRVQFRQGERVNTRASEHRQFASRRLEGRCFTRDTRRRQNRKPIRQNAIILERNRIGRRRERECPRSRRKRIGDWFDRVIREYDAVYRHRTAVRVSVDMIYGCRTTACKNQLVARRLGVAMVGHACRRKRISSREVGRKRIVGSIAVHGNRSCVRRVQFLHRDRIVTRTCVDRDSRRRRCSKRHRLT